MGHEFPRPPLHRAGGALNPLAVPLRCNELIASDDRTSDDSRTKIAHMIEDIPVGETLKRILISDDFVSNLVAYGRRGANSPLPNTWTTAPLIPRSPWATPQSQSVAIDGLAAWYEWHTSQLYQGSGAQNCTIVNGEPAVQNQVLLQILTPSKLWLQTRYRGIPLETTYGPFVDVSDYSYVPTWRPTVPVDHPAVGRDSAGYPDYILATQPSRNRATCAAILEIKTWWSYNGSLVAQL